MSSVACRVCLRTHVPTQDLPEQLETFHDELCDLETVQHKKLKYCASCTHLIKKCYKFKGQCQRANGLLKLWIKHENKDISEYRKKLPPPSLQFTNNSNSFLFECNHDEKSFHNTNVIKDCKQNLILKKDSSALAPDDRRHPELSKPNLNPNPSIPDRSRPDLRPAVVRLSSGLGPVLRPNIGSKSACTIVKNCDVRPSFRPNFVIRSDLRPSLKTEHVKAQNGMLTIDPNLLFVKSRPAIRPNLDLKPAFRPILGIRPTFRPNLSLKTVLKPNLSLTSLIQPKAGPGLSIQPIPSGNKQSKQNDLTCDPDFDVSYGTDPLSAVKDKSAVAIDKNTIDIVEKESVVHIEQQEVCMDDNPVDIDDAIASVVEIEPKKDDNECIKPEKEEVYDNDSTDSTMDDKEELYENDSINNTIDDKKELNDNDSTDSTMDDKEEFYDNDSIANTIDDKKELNDNDSAESTMDDKEEFYDYDSIDNTIDDKEELINNGNDTDNDIDSDEYTYEYLEQDIHLLDFVTKRKQKDPSETTSIEMKRAKKTTEQDIDLLDFVTKPKQQEPSESIRIENKQAKLTTEKELQDKILKIEDVFKKNVIQPAQNEGLPLETKGKGITRKYAKKAKVDLNPADIIYRTSNFKGIPNFKEKLFGLLDESPLVLEDETVLTKELFSVIYDKLHVREVKRLAMIVLEEDDFRGKLTAYLGVLHRKYNPEYESVFHVEFLHTEEKKREEFKRRELHPDYIRAAYKCELCFKTYTGQSFLDYHKKTYHDPAGPEICSICSYSMPNRRRLIKHRLQAHQAAYSCKLCPLRTNLVSVMRNHYNSHKGVQHQCPVCFKVYYNETTLRNHKRLAHPTQVCPTCAKQYTTEKGLRIHRETQHKDAPPVEPDQAVPCAECEITFDTQQSYQRHCDIAHSARFDDCGVPLRKRVRPPPSASTSEANLKKENEQGNMKLKKEKMKRTLYRRCEICDENVFVGKFSGSLYKHFLDHHPDVPYHASGCNVMQSKDFLCDECGKSFTCRATLRDHKNYHTGLRPHVCELCPARFHTKSHLWAHRSKHQDLRNHRCEECGKRYKNSTHLWTHMKIHIGDRCFKCKICDKGFLHNGSLKEHVKGVHYKQRRVKKPKKQAQEI